MILKNYKKYYLKDLKISFNVQENIIKISFSMQILILFSNNSI
jgi:hypothetical protein